MNSKIRKTTVKNSEISRMTPSNTSTYEAKYLPRHRCCISLNPIWKKEIEIDEEKSNKNIISKRERRKIDNKFEALEGRKGMMKQNIENAQIQQQW